MISHVSVNVILSNYVPGSTYTLILVIMIKLEVMAIMITPT